MTEQQFVFCFGIEEWRRSSCAPDYEVSSEGRVRRLTTASGATAGMVLKLTDPGNGRRKVSIIVDGKRKNLKVHRMVALAFLGPPPTPKHEVAHWDGDPANNNKDNLRWATRKENHADKKRHGTHGHSLTAGLVSEIRSMGQTGLTQKDIALRVGVSSRTVWDVLNNRSWKGDSPSL